MEDLIKALNSDDEVERIYAAQDIAESKNPELTEFLLKRLSAEESQAVKDAIIFALGNLSCFENYPMIFRLFRSPDAYLRNAAIGIFASEGKKAVEFLSSHLNHSDREVRKLILDALFATGDPDAARAIRQSLHDSSLNVRITAAEYLGRMADEESADELLAILQKETEPMLITAVLESLSVTEDQEIIRKLFSFFAPERDFSRTDKLYMPQLIYLWAKTGDSELLFKMIDALKPFEIYEEDIVHALEQAEERFTGICKEAHISELIKKIMEHTENKEIYALCRKLETRKQETL
ncbi:MAG: hypothetical protein BWK80_06150 [Desulfobacteraceae bacterium IS3]|nr:MAG: hypothetical protein BWK80_06150 [Desulfobacteraceae bacterium IS3]